MTAAAPPGGGGIVVAGVSQVFRRADREVRALDAFDLEIRSGEFLSIVGPSGCGKSTLLRIVAGLLKPSGGSVAIGGRRVERPQTAIGFVFQSPTLLEWRSVLDNVMLQIEMRGLDPAAYLERARRLLASVGLAEFENAYPRELSGGMRQRTAIIRGLIHDPPLLLMDEPFGALDALTREQMRIDLEALWLNSHKTVIFVTHSVDEAVLLSDRVVVMSPRPGRIERILDVDLPRPRGVEARDSAAFTQATRAITDIFLARGVLRRAP
ncbi:MAG: ABC transporter ATP-binding protein [Alphaproteobacteria bacterium]|nr:ABC transporter ATP-binding protein [Alphaproteobacteria bacterium]